MNQKIFLAILLVLFSVAVSAQQFLDSCYFINSKSGLNFRLNPKAEGYPIHIFEYGDVVKLAPKSEMKKDDWVKVVLNGEITGFVMSTYLSQNLKELPERSLYLFYVYNSSEQEFEGQENPEYHWFDEGRCYPYYEDAWHVPSSWNQQGDREVSYKDLRSRLSIELADIGNYVSRKMDNVYDLDHTFSITSRIDSSNTSYFYLPFKDGRDSLLFKDFHGEAIIGKSYIGEVRKLNSFVIREFYEEPTFYLMNKTNGQLGFISPSYPRISPDGKYVFSIHESPTYNRDNAGVLYIGKMNSTNPESISAVYASAYFKSWIPADDGESAFWISNREVLIKVYPVDNVVFKDSMKGGEPNYQWLKVRILE